MRRSLPGAPRRDRRRHRHAAELRRRARDREHAALGRARRAGAHPRLQRRRRADDDQGPPRQLLRQDVGLQQPAPVRDQVLADDGCTRSIPTTRRSAKTCGGSPRPAAWSARSSTRGSARLARAPRPSTRCATARSCSSSPASASRRWICPRCSARRTRSADGDSRVKAKLDAIGAYTSTLMVPDPALVKMAKLGIVIEHWMQDKQLSATADPVLDGARRALWRRAVHRDEHDVEHDDAERVRDRHRRGRRDVRAAGRLRQPRPRCSTGTTTSARTRTRAWCSTARTCRRRFFAEQRMDYQEIIAGTVGKENTYGTIVGRIAPGPFTYCRVSTDDFTGRIASYVGEGRFTDDRAGHLRRLRRDRGARLSAAAALHLPERLRAPRRSDEGLSRRRDRGRARHLPRVGSV